MTTTTAPELHTLAMDPQAFDRVVARLTADRDRRLAAIATLTSELHAMAGDKKSFRGTRSPVWGLTDLQAEKLAQRAAVHGDKHAITVLGDRAAAQLMAEAITDELVRMDNAYTGWTRFFPSITKSQPHIHRTLTCRTLHPTTQMTWAPELSGKTEAKAVEMLDEALCSVCFPTAPVALHNYVSKSSKWEQEQRQMAKDERAAAKAAKELTAEESQSFGNGSGRTLYGNDRIKTVAACKELIRKAVDEEVELEWFRSLKPGQRQGWDAESLSRRVSILTDNLVKHRADAAHAALVLVHREQAHEGHGMTAEAITEMKVRKLKAARKEWARL